MTPSDNLKIIDLFSVFANSNNLINTGLTKDNLHLNETGYDLWENSIREFVNN
jgi:lysophospholipase L1-like esterase